jgi:hypothetical protein
MLSALSWQPGLLFVGVAGLAFSRYLTRWRDSRLVALIAGAAMPLALLIAYFGAAGALRDLYLWNIDFNYRVYGPRQVAEGSTLVGRLGQILARNYGAEAIYFWLALPGLLVALAAVWNRAQRDGLSVRELAPRHAILIAPLIYLAFCMTDIQGGPDLVPLLPFISIFAALALVSLLDVVVSQLTLRWKMAIAPTLGAATFAGMLALVFVTSVADVFFAKPTFTSLEQQERDVAEMMRALRPGDQIFTHDAAAILVLSDVHNASRFFFLQRWMGDYLDMTEPDGFSGWFERLKAERPKVVVLGDRRIARPEAFQTWLDENYAPRDSRPFRWSAIYTQHENRYYLRKEAARNTPADPSGRPA